VGRGASPSEQSLMGPWADEALGRGMDRSAADIYAYNRLREHRDEIRAANAEALSRMLTLGVP
jgi:hypothetical protein